jgi:hypothetical protein
VRQQETLVDHGSEFGCDAKRRFHIERSSFMASHGLRARQVITLPISAIVAAIVGYVMASDSYGFVQPAILPLVLIAGAAGAVIRRIALAAIAGILVGYAGAAAIILRLSGDGWHVLGALGSLTAIPCVLASCFIARVVPGSKNEGKNRSLEQ